MTDYEDNCCGCDVCYNCGAKHSLVYICDECGEAIDPDEMIERGEDTHYHEECWYNKLGYKETLTLENAEKYGRKNKKAVELNGYYAEFYSAEEIDELIKRDYLASTKKESIDEEIKDFADWDKEAWMHAVND